MKQKTSAFFIAEGLEIQHGDFITESTSQITLESFRFKKQTPGELLYYISKTSCI